MTASLVAMAVVLTGAGCGGDEGGEGTRELTWFVPFQPGGALTTLSERCSQESNGRYTIALELLPTDASQQREQLVRRLGAEDDSIDLIGMDVIWTGEFANAGWIAPVPGDVESQVTENVFESVLETARFEGELYAIPVWSNTQLLWYRKDRVDEPPQTWDEMIDRAEELGPSEGRIQVQGNRYEGLVVWTNWMIESAGTSILAGPEELELEQEPTERALSIMGRLSRSPVAATNISTSTEDSARLGFEDGSSAFMINYPFVYPSAESNAPDVFEQMGAAKLPQVVKGEESAPPIGGINLGVSAFSDNQERAFEAAECLVQAENQIEVAELEGLPPVRSDLFDEPEIEEIYPGFASLIRESISDAAPRPSQSPAYQDVSLAIQRSVHPTDEIDPQDPTPTYEELRDKLEQAVAREGLL
ncbi:MAG: extracellular solute-binding protein [Thermoleophilaceae bacterium]